MVGRGRMLRSGVVAELLGVDRHTVARWAKEGRTRAARPKRKVQDPESEEKKYLKEEATAIKIV